MIPAAAFRRALLRWYDASHRQLPWRESSGFYRVWLSEIMLQQTRVEAVIPYYHRFLEAFPDVHALAAAPEQDVLARWSGLGYYSRARNIHAAAKAIAAEGFPETYDEILKLPGIGAYTAAAIASIANGQAHAAVDGNVIRVVSRLTNNPSEVSNPATRRAIAESAQALLAPKRPGDFNQAMMELGATLCIPRTPRCGECPVIAFCEARAAGTERQLPVKAPRPQARECSLDLVLLRRAEELFLVQRGPTEKRLANFWELPQPDAFSKLRLTLDKEFSHRIVNDLFRVTVWKAAVPRRLPEGRWFPRSQLASIPLTTTSRKAIHPGR